MSPTPFIKTARLAARSGAAVVIARGTETEIFKRVVAGESLGTLLVPNVEPDSARKRWLAGQLSSKGRLQRDDGAVKALQSSGRSLLVVGVVEVSGSFQRGDLIICVDTTGREIARGLINYNAEDVRKIKGASSAQIESLLGFVLEPELVHRDNMTLV